MKKWFVFLSLISINYGQEIVGDWREETPLIETEVPSCAYPGFYFLHHNGFFYGIGTKGTIYYANLRQDGQLGQWKKTASPKTHLRVYAPVIINEHMYLGCDGVDISGLYQAKILQDGHIEQWKKCFYQVNVYKFDPDFPAYASYYCYGRFYFFYGKNISYTTIEEDGSIGSWQELTSSQTKKVGDVGFTNGYFYNIANMKEVWVGKVEQSGDIKEWQQTYTLPGDIKFLGSFAYGGLIFAAGNDGNLYYAKVSIDGEINKWEKIKALPSDLKCRPVKMLIVNNRLYLVRWTSGQWVEGTVYHPIYSTQILINLEEKTASELGIKEETTKPIKITREDSKLTHIVVDWDNPKIIIAWDDFHKKLIRSLDGGGTWHFVDIGNIDLINLAKISKGDFLMLTTNNLLRSPDTGKTWISSREGLPEFQIRYYSEFSDKFKDRKRIGICLSQPNVIYLALPEEKIYKSTDGGNRWVQRSLGVTWRYYGSEVLCISVDPFNPNIAYVATSEDIFNTIDGGKHWNKTAAPEGVYLDNVKNILVIRHEENDNSSVFIAIYEPSSTRYKVFVSQDVGISWSPTTKEEWMVLSSSITSNPDNPDVIYKTGGGYIYKSINGGKIWTILLKPE